MEKRADRIKNQLGMPAGTAQNRLRKQILFKYVSLAKHNFCYVCKKKIETPKELSIEHKLPWEDIDTELFWDLDNITFSHLKCNRPHRLSERSRKVGPEGTAWCQHCQEFKPVSEFWKSGRRWNGLDEICKEHRKAKRARTR